MKIDGMKCSSCVAPIESALLELPGVDLAEVNFATETARVVGKKNLIFEDIKIVMEEMGYPVTDMSEVKHMSHDEDIPKDMSKTKIELWVAFGFALPLFFNMFLEMAGSPYALPGGLQLIFATIVQFWPGRKFYIRSWAGLKHRSVNMDTLVMLGTSAAYFYSLGSVLIGSPEYYFEASAVVIAFVLLGRFWEDRAKHTAREAIHALMEQVPETAWIKKGGQMVEVFLSELKVGDVVIVKAWERIPVDGVVTQGESEVNEAMITGEARPVHKKKGAKVIGGTLNSSGTLHVEITALGVESTLSKMIKLVERAQSSRPPIQHLVDRVASIFVPIVIGVSLLTFLVWFAMGYNAGDSLLPAVAVLVIACPCALGLATPMAVVVGIGNLAKQGVLVKDLSVLETLTKVNMVVFDKTGTLTRGEFKLTNTESFIKSKTAKDLQVLAASLQQGSEHLLAQPFLKKIKAEELLPVTGFKSVQGKGVEGKIKRSLYALGSKGYMKSLGLKVPATKIKGTETVVFLAKLGSKPELLGCFYLEDTPRTLAEKVIRTLGKMDVKSYLLTGDIKANAAEIAKKLKIFDYKAEISPEGKLKTIEELRKEGYHLAMVGDGVNDAPALAAAEVGFAMGSGTDVALEAAPVTLMRTNLGLIPLTFNMSQRVMGIIKQNLFWAFIFNIVGIGFAALGLLSPMIAGAAMALSSIMVVGNSLRLRKTKHLKV